MTGFWKAYLKSTRPYTFFITGTAGLCGILTVGGEVDALRTGISLLLLFSAYGINQVVNDLLGTREDRYNDVKRPSITGELDIRKAWLLTGLIFIMGGLITYFLNPYVMAIYVAGYAFNVIYEKLKSIPMIGNLWFGLMISLAPLFGAMSTTGMSYSDIIVERELLLLILIFVLIQSNLCYFTYFKDHKGDRKAGVMTLVALLRPRRARFLNLILFPVPFVFLTVLSFGGYIEPKPGVFSFSLIGASLVTYLILVVMLLKDHPSKRKPLELNFQGAVLFHNGLIALFNPWLGISLGVISFLLIATVFHIMYRKGFYG